jgi:hypothetical protein
LGFLLYFGYCQNPIPQHNGMLFEGGGSMIIKAAQWIARAFGF